MNPKNLTAALALLLLPDLAPAQTSPAADPQADLATMQQKAAADPQLKMLFDSLSRSSSETARQRFERLIRYSGYFPQGGLKRPMNIAAPAQLRAAEARARAAQQILAADLNGDWQVSLEEIRTALSVRRLQGPAEAMLTYDANGDGVLSTDEIHAAADDSAARYASPRTNPLVLLDFDNDGMLTPEEYNRGLAALGG